MSESLAGLVTDAWFSKYTYTYACCHVAKPDSIDKIRIIADVKKFSRRYKQM